MSTGDDHARTNGNPALSAAETLSAILDLESQDVSVLQIRTFGHGSRAAVEIVLSNNEVMSFDSIRDMTRPANLAAELVACTGATPKLTGARAIQVASLVRKLADAQKTMSDNEIAVEWGSSYLQSSDVVDLDMDDQGQRWAAFSHLEQHNPTIKVKETGITIAAASIVLRHLDGARFVRTGWFFQHVRTLDIGISQSMLATRMTRIGWVRRAATGRIKATAPRGGEFLAWSFWTVPAGWEHDQ